MIKSLAVYVGQYRKYLYLVPLFVLLDVLCELSMPLLMSKIVDVGIVDKDIAYIAQDRAVHGAAGLCGHLFRRCST